MSSDRTRLLTTTGAVLALAALLGARITLAAPQSPGTGTGTETLPPTTTTGAADLPPPNLAPLDEPATEAEPGAEFDDATLAPDPSPVDDPTGEPAPAPPLRDDDLMRVQTPGLPMPVPAAGSEAAIPAGDDPFVLSPDKLREGTQSAGLSVEVVAPKTMNMHKPADVTIIVKNPGPGDAHGVIVRDTLPDGLKYLSSVPPGKAVGPIVAWDLGTMPAGSERKMKVSVEPVQRGNFDHTATVTMLAGAKSKTQILEPRLKVEQLVSRREVLKGQQVQFDIAITNEGDGPARDLHVLATLGEGLDNVQGRTLESTDVRTIGPKETVRLKPLIVDTVDGGTQSCHVVVTSPDVVAAAESTASVNVVEPKLQLALVGSPTRYTDTIAEYHLTVTNPGTAPAYDVRVSTALVGDGKPMVPEGVTWNSTTRRLTWPPTQIEAGGKPTEYTFYVRMGGSGHFQVNADATAKGPLSARATCATEVSGFAKMVVDVSEPKGILDVGQNTVFKVRIRNDGSKEATNILVRAKFDPSLLPLETAGTTETAGLDKETSTLVFPVIDRLVPGAETVLSIRVEATKPGFPACRVFLTHQDLNGEQIEEVAHTRVMQSPSPGK